MRYDASGQDLIGYATPDSQVWGSRSPVASFAYSNNAQFSTLPLSATIPYFAITSGGMEFEIPYYSRFHKLGTSFPTNIIDYYGDVDDGREPTGLVIFRVITQTPQNTTVYLYRYAADDYNFGYLLGAPFTQVNTIPQP